MPASHHVSTEALKMSVLHKFHERHARLWWLLLCLGATIGLLVFATAVTGW